MKRKLVFGVAFVTLIVAGFATYSWAAASADVQTLNGCVARDGQLRLVAVTGACKKDETAVSWNTVGPQGLQGVQGLQGAAGPAGAAGQNGRDGGAAADPNAIAGTVAIVAQKQGSINTTLTGFAHEIVSPRDLASGQATGNRQHKPITITKELDAATPKLLQALVTNETLTSVLIGLLRNGQQVATVKLTNAGIADYAAHGDTETWQFTYQKIVWTWVDGGITAQDDWEAR